MLKWFSFQNRFSSSIATNWKSACIIVFCISCEIYFLCACMNIFQCYIFLLYIPMLNFFSLIFFWYRLWSQWQRKKRWNLHFRRNQFYILCKFGIFIHTFAMNSTQVFKPFYEPNKKKHLTKKIADLTLSTAFENSIAMTHAVIKLQFHFFGNKKANIHIYRLDVLSTGTQNSWPRACGQVRECLFISNKYTHVKKKPSQSG